MIVVAAFEPPAVVTGLDDVAVVGQPVEQRGGHLGVAEHAGPFAECEIGGDNDGSTLIEPANQVEERLATRLSKGQISEFVQHDEVHPGQMFGKPALVSVTGLDLKAIDEADIIDATAGAGSDAASGDCDSQVGFACAGATDEHNVALLGDEVPAGEIVDECLIEWRAFEPEVIEVLGQRQLGDSEMVLDRSRLLLFDLGAEQVADDVLRFVLTLDRSPHPDRSLTMALQYHQAAWRVGLSAAGPGNGDAAMAALRFRLAPPTGGHGVRGNNALTIKLGHSVAADQLQSRLSGFRWRRHQRSSP